MTTTVKLAVGGLLILIIGIGVGAAGNAPPQIVVREVPGPTVTVNVTPQSCIDALDTAGVGFGLVSDVFDTFLNEDVAGLQRAADQINDIDTDQFGADSADCRAGAAAVAS